ncbi:hypothetical protein J3R30DRAFT_3483806 [Lentinula aciculospora]|uniref:Uncharacterized protein n=1 Tax=Lentinula aciculospora TaxID=153920 RepID=A0A9W9A8V9_9AGAR|nr:hypothetical protein J3R30DRAFT_3483806 [Lentinula aciculospora]
MSTLATRLNELAAANGKGLLDDDEYRILRQDAFERYAELGNSERSNEDSKVNTSEPTTSFTPNSVQPRPSKPFRRPSEVKMNTTTSNKSKKSSNNVISSFIRRATSPLRTATSLPGPSNLSPSTSRKNSHEPAISNSSSRKNSNSGNLNYSVPDPHLLSPPTSPSRPVHNHSKRSQRSSPPMKSFSSSSKLTTKVTLAANHDIFEDGGLFTSADIRRAITDLDEDAKRLFRAFDELEESAKAKAQSSRGRLAILPSSSSSNLLSPPTIQHRSRSDSAATASGGEMRYATPGCNSSSKSVHTRVRSRSTTSTSIQPMPTICSTGASSIHTTVSTSSTGRTSVSSANVHGHAAPAASTHSHTHALSRAASTASSSRSVSILSSSDPSTHQRGESTEFDRSGPGPSAPGHKQYRPADRAKGYFKGDLDEQDELDRSDELNEQNEIRRIQQRRRDVIGRYDTRREYLKARLRGAELHEKVVKGR